LDAVRYAALQPIRGFGATIFRRTSPQITQQGGLWDESNNLYPYLDGIPNKTRLEWAFPPYKCKIRFAHLQYDSDKYKYQGAQMPYIGIDEATHFEEETTFYLFSRNRSTCGVRPRIRLTCNPDANSWLARFLTPWIEPDYPYPAKSGEIRYFRRDGGLIEWLPPGQRHPDAKSFTFIAASIYDNPALLAANPEYLANLKALPLVERQRLLFGDWHITATGNTFRREWFANRILAIPPAHFEKVVRYWDLAATAETGKNDPDWTVGVKMGRLNGVYYVLDVQRVRDTPGQVERLIKATADLDGTGVEIWMEQEPGSAGVNTIATYRKVLAGYPFHGNKTTGSKLERANPVSSQAEGGNIVLIAGLWNEAFINEHVAFPTKGVHDDMVDANSGAFEQLTQPKKSGGFVTLDPKQVEALSKTNLFW
jgi:predicted phage terminase large subunit-like protein